MRKQLDNILLIQDDCLEELPKLSGKSIDAVITDTPYGIAFMNKKWDYDVPSIELWQEVLRVLKPGGHALVACGTRTQHRMAVNLEDVGFEIRDLIFYHYGSGFPTSQMDYGVCDGSVITPWMSENGANSTALQHLF